MGGIFCAEPRADAWCADFEAALAALRAGPRPAARTVLYCIWKDPWMSISADTYIANMLAEAACHVPSLGQARYPSFSWDDAALAGIDAVLLSSEPYSFTQEHADALARQLGKPVLLVDGEMLSWYGSRALAGLDYVRQLMARLERECLAAPRAASMD